ncbi:MAG TPA: MFS transporter [Henriciella marina]|uniref:MFS transporter n=1 Tax=Henriciella sp. TaxID=1968823 RepID=UPI001854880A|nr:MFS transporter [Henriciella sp.]HIG23790.1 MFS transporter [Henriciella sp.]HIK65220.1 MFS transporter [Henriciella marina]
MNLRLISLVFAPFAFGTSAFAFVGLIDPMAEGLGIGVPLAGQLQTVFAVACGIGGPFLARALAGKDRKRLLLFVIAILVAMNVASALAPNFAAIAGIRIAGGIFAALTLPLAATIGVNMVSEAQRPAAIATVFAGYTLAFLVGMPVATLLGDTFGWRAAFWFAGAISIVALGIIALGAPAGVQAPSVAGADFKTALRGDNTRLLLITMIGFSATFTTVSFIGPVITAFTGLTGAAIGAVQIATGVGSLLGLPAGAMLARLPLRTSLTVLMLITFATQALFSFGILIDTGVFAIPLIILAMALGSGALFASNPVIQSELAKSAGPAATIAFALNSSMVYFGQGLGATLGGAVTAAYDIGWIGAMGSAISLLALIIITRLRPSNEMTESNTR